MTYQQWADHHAKIFNLNAPDDNALLGSWIGVFQSCGYSVEELFDATDRIAASVPIPETRLQQLGALHSTVRSGRVSRQNNFQGEYTVKRICTFELCDGTGWLSLPHPKSLADGRWVHPWYTCAVLCKCDHGHRIAQTYGGETKRTKRSTPPIGLETYERQNPYWQTQLKERAAQQEAERKVREKTADAEPKSPRQLLMAQAFDDAVARIKRRYRLQ